jgi:hypothetical protein
MPNHVMQSVNPPLAQPKDVKRQISIHPSIHAHHVVGENGYRESNTHLEGKATAVSPALCRMVKRRSILLSFIVGS